MSIWGAVGYIEMAIAEEECEFGTGEMSPTGTSGEELLSLGLENPCLGRTVCVRVANSAPSDAVDAVFTYVESSGVSLISGFSAGISYDLNVVGATGLLDDHEFSASVTVAYGYGFHHLEGLTVFAYRRYRISWSYAAHAPFEDWETFAEGSTVSEVVFPVSSPEFADPPSLNIEGGQFCSTQTGVALYTVGWVLDAGTTGYVGDISDVFTEVTLDNS